MKLQDYLDANGLNGMDFARLLKVTPQTVYRLLKKKGRPSIRLASKIYQKTGGKVTIDELFDYTVI